MGSGTADLFGFFFSEIRLCGFQSCQASCSASACGTILKLCESSDILFMPTHHTHTQKDRKYVVHNHHATYHKMLLQVLALSALSDVFLAWIFMRPWFSHKQHAITIALEPSSNTTQHVAADPQQHHRRRGHPCTSAHHHVKCQNVYVPIHGSHVRLYIRCT